MKIIRNLIFLNLFLVIFSFTQDFSPAYPLVDMPGDNVGMDVLSTSDPYSDPSFPPCLSWINNADSLCSVYLSLLDSSMKDQILIKADSIEKSNTQISYLNNNSGIQVAWQESVDSFWRVVFRDYFFNDSLGAEKVILDSLVANPQFAMSAEGIVWVENGSLFFFDFDQAELTPQLIDTGICSNPELPPGEIYSYEPEMLYEKEISGEKQIFLADQDYRHPGVWNISQISFGGSNANPRFGFEGNIAYQKKINNYWSLYYYEYFFGQIDSTKQMGINFEHPIVFTYPQVTKDITPFFVVFDTDSLPDNREIFIKVLSGENFDSFKNISNSEGDDFSPEIIFLKYLYRDDLALLWYKKTNDKTDIWISKTRYNPNWGAVDDEQIASSFHLNQNYPNPFNPSTTIGYYITKPGDVELTIFDVSGSKIRTLYQGFRGRGEYKENFDAKGLASGIYFYRMTQGKTSVTKQMLLIR